MDRQTELMNADHRTVLEVEDYRADGEKLILSLSNFGNGVATYLELVILTAFEETEDSEPDITSTGLTRRPEDPAQNRRGKSIKAEKTNISFEARSGMSLRSKPTGQTLGHGFGIGVPG